MAVTETEVDLDAIAAGVPARAPHADPITIAAVPTPLGVMVGGAVAEGVCLLEFCDRRAMHTEFKELSRRMDRPVVVEGSKAAAGRLEAVRAEMGAYWAGRLKAFETPLVMPGTEFERRVWSRLIEIPMGRTISYAELARDVGSPEGFRAVGRANGRNRIAVVVPCHRVIASDGTLGGYGGGLDRKERLIEHERKIAGELLFA